MKRRLAGALLATLWCGRAAAHPGLSLAIHDATEGVQRDPTDVALRVERADLYRRAGHHHDALADLRVALGRQPTHEGALLQRALVRIALGQSRAARADLDRVLADGEGPSAAWAARARLHGAAGRTAAARRDYDAAIALRPSPDFFLERGRADQADQAWDAAAQGYRQGVAATQGAVVLRLALVAAERHRANPAAALEEINALLAQAPTRVDWILVRAEVLAELGQGAHATIERLRALALANAMLSRRATEFSRRTLSETYLALQSTEPLS